MAILFAFTTSVVLFVYQKPAKSTTNLFDLCIVTSVNIIFYLYSLQHHLISAHLTTVYPPISTPI